MKMLLKFLGKVAGIVLVLVAALVIFAMLTLKPNLPEQTLALQSAEVTGTNQVLVFGASGKLGLEVVSDLVARGDKVTAFVRSSSDRSQLEALEADFAVGDVMEAETVEAAFTTGDFDAVITAISGMGTANLDYLGNAHIFDAAKKAGVGRVIFVSSVGAGDSYESAPLISRLALRKVLPLKTQAEDHLRLSGLDYTILRPGGLPPGFVETGRGILSEDATTMGFIKRPDLARIIIGVLDDDQTIGKTLAVVDPGLERPWAGADPE